VEQVELAQVYKLDTEVAELFDRKILEAQEVGETTGSN